MPFDDILEANRTYQATHPEPLHLDHRPAQKLMVIACFDCRLTVMLEEALGLKRGDAVVFRFSGNTPARESEVLRSVAVAVYLLEIERVLVLGHTECGLAKVNTLRLLDAIQSRNVSRDHFGDDPIREWFGAFGSERENVLKTAEAILNSPLFPDDLEVAGAVIDTFTGELQML